MGNKKSKAAALGSVELTEEDFQSLLNDTSFDRDQLIEWHKGFLEECPDGKMRKEDFKQYYLKLYPNGRPDSYATNVFKVFDIEKNGFIDFVDFIMALSITTMGNSKKKIALAFKLYDLDRNNFVDESEIVKIVNAIFELLSVYDEGSSEEQELGRMSSECAAVLLRKLDKNHDNLISKDEFIDGCLSDESIRKLLVPTT